MGPYGRVEGRESAVMLLRVADGAGLCERAQGAGVLDRALFRDARLDAEHGQAGAVAEVEEHPGVAGAQVDLEDLRPLEGCLLVMFTTVTPVSSATTLGRESISRTPKSSAPMKTKLKLSPG